MTWTFVETREKGCGLVANRKGGGARRTDIPIDYVEANPTGNRRSRRLHAREAKAAQHGRSIGTPTGGAPAHPKLLNPQQPDHADNEPEPNSQACRTDSTGERNGEFVSDFGRQTNCAQVGRRRVRPRYDRNGK